MIAAPDKGLIRNGLDATRTAHHVLLALHFEEHAADVRAALNQK